MRIEARIWIDIGPVVERSTETRNPLHLTARPTSVLIRFRGIREKGKDKR